MGFGGSITGGDFLSIQSILRIAVTICFNFMFHVTPIKVFSKKAKNTFIRKVKMADNLGPNGLVVSAGK
jgi:hypothetical protein